MPIEYSKEGQRCFSGQSYLWWGEKWEKAPGEDPSSLNVLLLYLATMKGGGHLVLMTTWQAVISLVPRKGLGWRWEYPSLSELCGVTPIVGDFGKGQGQSGKTACHEGSMVDEVARSEMEIFGLRFQQKFVGRLVKWKNLIQLGRLVK